MSVGVDLDVEDVSTAALASKVAKLPMVTTSVTVGTQEQASSVAVRTPALLVD